MKPWVLKKDPSCSSKLNAVLHIAMETLRICGILLQPLIPNISKNLLNAIMVPENQRVFEATKRLSWNQKKFTAVSLCPEKVVLFKRIILEKEKRGKSQKA